MRLTIDNITLAKILILAVSVPFWIFVYFSFVPESIRAAGMGGMVAFVIALFAVADSVILFDYMLAHVDMH